MAFQDIVFELTGEIPGLPFPLARTKINEALGTIYDANLWSFQVLENGWLTPGLQFGANLQSTGTITATAYSNQIVGDADAAAAWVAYSELPLFTQFQFRVPYWSLYNIVGFDGVDTLTLDRPWMEPSGAGQSYMVYQAYFPAPYVDFKRFFEIRDTTNAAPLDYWTYGRKDLALIDPQRTNFNQPSYVVPFELDQRPGSATLGFMLYELWPHPLSVLPYTYSYLRRGAMLSAPGDTLPQPITEELVKWRAREVSYLWKEAQKGEGLARGSGADYRFLSQAAAIEYGKKLKQARDLDRDKAELYFSRFVRGAAMGADGYPFANILGQLNVGRF